MENSNIEWTDNTFNPWWGCMKVSEECKHCYAEFTDNRWHGGHWGPNSDRKEMSEAYWHKPFLWQKHAAAAGIQVKVFCASMADVFEDHDQVIEWRNRLFELIETTPNLTWQLLTKRPENIMSMVPDTWRVCFPENVWVGTSVGNHQSAVERIPHLLLVPASVRFLSCEPLLGELDFYKVSGEWPLQNHPWRNAPILDGIHWLIAGGESGPKARPMNVTWLRTLRDQCLSVGVPFFFKQWGEWISELNINPLDVNHYTESDAYVTLTPGGTDYTGEYMMRLGKKNAGSLLDGVNYKQFPK